jgi:hypothetical protein
MKGNVALGFVLALAAGGVGVAVAQSEAAGPAVPELEARQDVALSPQQMLSEAGTYVPGMKAAARTVRGQLTEARKQRDVVKVLCLNDKVNQMDVATRSASDRIEMLKAAVESRDADGARHEFTVLAVLRDQVRTLRTEANQCIGEEAGFIGESKVTVEIDPSIPDEDPSDFPDDPLLTDPPIVMSPTY